MRLPTISLACALQLLAFSSLAAPQASPHVYDKGIGYVCSKDLSRWEDCTCRLYTTPTLPPKRIFSIGMKFAP